MYINNKFVNTSDNYLLEIKFDNVINVLCLKNGYLNTS